VRSCLIADCDIVVVVVENRGGKGCCRAGLTREGFQTLDTLVLLTAGRCGSIHIIHQVLTDVWEIPAEKFHGLGILAFTKTIVTSTIVLDNELSEYASLL
jgi:hypothetical protein